MKWTLRRVGNIPLFTVNKEVTETGLHTFPGETGRVLDKFLWPLTSLQLWATHGEKKRRDRKSHLWDTQCFCVCEKVISMSWQHAGRLFPSIRFYMVVEKSFDMVKCTSSKWPESRWQMSGAPDVLLNIPKIHMIFSGNILVAGEELAWCFIPCIYAWQW